MSMNVADINIQHVERTQTVTSENTESLTDSVKKSFISGVFAGAVGLFIPSPKPDQMEMPNTRVNIARHNGTNFNGINLTENKTETVFSSCSGLSHPIDVHFHQPTPEEYSRQRRFDGMV